MNVHVVMGGPSAEYEVSINSGCKVVENLLAAGHTIRAVVIGRDRRLYSSGNLSAPLIPVQAAAPGSSPGFSGPYSPADSADVWRGCEVAFLALHGSFGEDGTFQGYLETLGIRYTGSGVGPSALAMDKVATKFMYAQNGLDTPPFVLFGKDHPETTMESCVARLGLPCFAKCPQSGSSKLMGRAESANELGSLVKKLLKSSETVLVEQSVTGPEFSCGVLETADGSLRALPPVEIRPRTAAFFDYNAKYVDNASEELVPAPRPEPLLGRIRQQALAAHRLLGCHGYSRTDMMFADDKLYVLETNTLPGLTPNSLLPKTFAAAGGTYVGLLEQMLETARTKRFDDSL